MPRLPLILLPIELAAAGVGCSDASNSTRPCYPSGQASVPCAPHPVLTKDDLPDCQVPMTSDCPICAMSCSRLTGT